MVGQISYTEEQIIFVLQQLLAGEKRDVILQEYKREFNKALSTAQLRYIKIKYGHDPEFGQVQPSYSINHHISNYFRQSLIVTAMINRKLPKNGGNRKTAKEPSKKETIQLAQPMSDGPYPTVMLVSQPNSGSLQSLPADFPAMRHLIEYNQGPSEPLITDKGLSLLHQQSQQQHAGLPNHQLETSTEQPSGTYWFDQYQPTSYSTAYGNQPVLHYCNQILYPSVAKKRKHDELVEPTSMLTAELASTRGLEDTLYIDTTALETAEKREKRRKLESPAADYTPIPTATPAQTPTDSMADQKVTKRSKVYFSNGVPSQRSVPPNDLTTMEDELSPWSKLAEGTDPENRPQKPMTTPPSLRTWKGIVHLDGPSPQGRISKAVKSATVYTNQELTFPREYGSPLFDNTGSSLRYNHQVDASYYPLSLEVYDPALDPAFEHCVDATLQPRAGDAILETHSSASVGNDDNQEQSASGSTTVPHQFDFEEDFDFFKEIEGFDWSVCLPTDADQTQKADGQTQLSE
ncbi:hypothetical protein CDEST_12206 [Colletotrichum destructivum]|uniref:Clr5 domain-containing protein n=1 Tax=Colletotrichum destructivum TaxID=34406 RepID=A0AAX4IVD8_9PEZI|nr:hypothetical protein CDEST_12206 [Colletotrichum destructivum]